MRFTVLASGSKGNASLLQWDRFGLLLDAGLGPRQLAYRLAAVGASWQMVNAVVLTHAHSDHWNDRTLAELRQRGIPLYCHAEHRSYLAGYSAAFRALSLARLVEEYRDDHDVKLPHGLRCRPLALRHDGAATFGFRFDAGGHGAGEACALGYLADLGCWDRWLVEALADVDVLAVEFNHDVDLEYRSGRHARLIARVLGDEGHLSNDQAAALLRAVLRQSAPGRPRHVIQLHLSQDCNRPELAVAAALDVLREAAHPTRLHTASQDRPLPTIELAAPLNGVGQPVPPCPARPSRPARLRPSRPFLQRWLPGIETE